MSQYVKVQVRGRLVAGEVVIDSVVDGRTELLVTLKGPAPMLVAESLRDFFSEPANMARAESGESASLQTTLLRDWVEGAE